MLDYEQTLKVVEDFLSSPFTYDSVKIVAQPNIERVIFRYRRDKIYLDRYHFTNYKNYIPQIYQTLFIPIRGEFRLEIGTRDTVLNTINLKKSSYLSINHAQNWIGMYPQEEEALSISVIGPKFEKAELIPPPLSKGSLDSFSEQRLLDEFHESIFSDVETFKFNV